MGLAWATQPDPSCNGRKERKEGASGEDREAEEETKVDEWCAPVMLALGWGEAISQQTQSQHGLHEILYQGKVVIKRKKVVGVTKITTSTRFTVPIHTHVNYNSLTNVHFLQVYLETS